jgi:hypothetical protein
MALVVACLLCKHEALNSNPSPTKNKQTKALAPMKTESVCFGKSS